MPIVIVVQAVALDDDQKFIAAVAEVRRSFWRHDVVLRTAEVEGTWKRAYTEIGWCTNVKAVFAGSCTSVPDEVNNVLSRAIEAEQRRLKAEEDAKREHAHREACDRHWTPAPTDLPVAVATMRSR